MAATYSPEVNERIAELQAEIKRLKEGNGRPELLPHKDARLLSDLTDAYSHEIRNRITWLCKAIIPGSFYYKERIRGVKAKYLKSEKELSDRELELARKCAEEMIGLLTKYAKEARELNEHI